MGTAMTTMTSTDMDALVIFGHLGAMWHEPAG
jgi:hypothetical protein